MLKVLAPHVEAGWPVIGLEPACLLAIRDDYRFLGLCEVAEQVADKAILFEKFIAKEKMAKRFQLEFSPQQQQVLVHGHCHQKAVAAILIAVSIESLLLMFKTALGYSDQLVPAVWMMLAAVGLLIGLGLYVYLSTRTESLLHQNNGTKPYSGQKLHGR